MNPETCFYPHLQRKQISLMCSNTVLALKCLALRQCANTLIWVVCIIHVSLISGTKIPHWNLSYPLVDILNTTLKCANVVNSHFQTYSSWSCQISQQTLWFPTETCRLGVHNMKSKAHTEDTVRYSKCMALTIFRPQHWKSLVLLW